VHSAGAEAEGQLVPHPGGKEPTDLDDLPGTCRGACLSWVALFAAFLSATFQTAYASISACRAAYAMVHAAWSRSRSCCELVTSMLQGAWDMLLQVSRCDCGAALRQLVSGDCFCLPSPPLPTGRPTERDSERGIRLREALILIGAFSAAALIMLALDLRFGGYERPQEVLGWVILGTLLGTVGALLGTLTAALATPTDRGTCCEALLEWRASGRMVDDMEPLGMALAATAALSAALSGLVAWSLHLYPPDARARAMLLFDGGLLVACAARFGYKTWRGCSGGGRRLRLHAGGAPGDCHWPVML